MILFNMTLYFWVKTLFLHYLSPLDEGDKKTNK